MKGPRDIIQAPLISEKGTALAESANQFLFKVRPDANKMKLSTRWKRCLKSKVVDVRMARYLGKIRRVGRSMGGGRTGKRLTSRSKRVTKSTFLVAHKSRN
jgi:large subunit ribosomal protein L23